MNSPQNLRFDGLQVLRFVAAAMVVVTHSTLYVSERLEPGFTVWTGGVTGVNIFFVISGFVMIISSLGLLGRPDGAKVFLSRRFVRIVPLYWAITTFKLATLLLTAGFVLHAKLDWGDTLLSYLFLPSLNADGEIKPLLGVGWTLNYEMFFYVLFGLAMWMRIDPVRSILILFVGLSVIGAVVQPTGTAARFYTDNIVIGFVLGMLLARWCIARRPQVPAWLCLAAIVIGFYMLVHPYDDPPYWTRPLLRDLPAAVIVAAVACLEPALRGRTPRWLMLLGDSSYALYLIHPIVAPTVPTVMAKLGIISPTLSIIGSLALSTAASVLVYLYAEKPTTERLKRLFEPRTPRDRGTAQNRPRPAAR